MLIGVTPFFNKNREMLLNKIQKAKVVFPDRKKYKIKFSDSIADLIVKLLERDTSKRLGCGQGNYKDVLSHEVFSKINIKKLEKLELEPPFKPNLSEHDLSKYFNVQ